MKKMAILTLLLASFINSKALAEVQFLPEAKENMYQKASASASGDGSRCANAGYIYTSCEGAMADECPYRAGYYKTCCPAGYLYRKEECLNASYSSDSCAGFYKCEELTNEQKCVSDGYKQNPEIVNGYTMEWMCSYPDNMITCPYDTHYKKCDTSCKDQGYFFSWDSNPCPDEKTTTETSVVTQSFSIEHCPSNSTYVKCIPGGISVSLLTSSDCKAEGFSATWPTSYCDAYSCHSATMPGCPVGQTLKTCTDTTGHYWKCVGDTVVEPVYIEF